jgi:hypothetical protein
MFELFEFYSKIVYIDFFIKKSRASNGKGIITRTQAHRDYSIFSYNNNSRRIPAGRSVTGDVRFMDESHSNTRRVEMPKDKEPGWRGESEVRDVREWVFAPRPAWAGDLWETPVPGRIRPPRATIAAGPYGWLKCRVVHRHDSKTK